MRELRRPIGNCPSGTSRPPPAFPAALRTAWQSLPNVSAASTTRSSSCGRNSACANFASATRWAISPGSKFHSPNCSIALIASPARQAITQRLRQLGFKFVTLDLDGFRSGSMNAVVPIESLLAARKLEPRQNRREKTSRTPLSRLGSAVEFVRNHRRWTSLRNTAVKRATPGFAEPGEIVAKFARTW